MLVTLVLSTLVLLQQRPSRAPAEVRPIAGAAGDFTHATYARLAGSWFEIGRELGRLGEERHHAAPGRATDPERVRAQREYFALHDPAEVERMRGLASHFGLEDALDEFQLDGLAYGTVQAGCTVVYYPPATTEDGHGVLTRNFDFTTGTFEGKRPAAGESIACAEPYVLELHPEGGMASLALVAFDLLGVIDGINEEGLTVALLADDELFAIGKAHPGPAGQPGFDVLQVGRFLLDTCKDVAEAKAALRGARLYYSSIPCHYLIADRHGDAFVWENALDLAGGHVIEDPGYPLVSTNYLQHLHPDPDRMPADSDALGLFGRQHTVLARIEEQAKLSLDEMRDNARCVSPVHRAPAGRAPGRTLWRTLYFPEQRSLEVDFYLGDGGGDGGAAIRRSSPVRFALSGESPPGESPR